MEDLFEAFEPVSKAAWRKKIEKELKGKPFEELKWAVSEDLRVEPFYTESDFQNFAPPMAFNKSWQIGESIYISKEKNPNDILIQALEGGVTAPGLVLAGSDFWAADILKSVQPDIIELYFYLENQSAEYWQKIIRSYADYAGQAGLKSSHLNGGFHIHPTTLNKTLTEQVNDLFPRYRYIQIEIGKNSITTEEIVPSLSTALADAIQLLDKWTDMGMDADAIAKKISFTVYIGNSYFMEIAKLRALRLLWANILKGYRIKSAAPAYLDVHFAQTSYEDDKYTNMIAATTMAMSAIIGGANRLTVNPADAASGATSFSRRIARNVQHLLMMESHFDKVADPAAGSYYMEKLTEKITTLVWQKLSTS